MTSKKIFKIKRKEIIDPQKEWFNKCIHQFKQLNTRERFDIREEDFYPCYDDATNITGYDTHYEYHPAWAARILAKTKPVKHIDISSKLAFSTMVSAFIPVEFYDYRPANLKIDNLKCLQADLTNLQFKDESIQSLSCMHTVEHVGLGRYGDKIDPDGDLKAVSELKRVLAKSGNLLFVVPVGKKSKLQFNAHRIYTYDMIIEYFKDFKLIDFSYIKSQMSENEYINNATREDSFSDDYGCGCFWFEKEI
ncbi:MAG: DUF268 domain-containing protein [bacterium]